MAGGSEISAVFRGLADDAAQAGERIGTSISRFFEDTAEKEDAAVATHMTAEDANTQAAHSVRPPDETLPTGSGSAAGEPGPESAGAARIRRLLEGKGDASGPEASGGETSASGPGDGANAAAGKEDAVGTKGVGKCGKAGEPVDVVSGQMVMSRLDVFLPGVLPLTLRRTYSSGYRGAGLFGPGFCSTLDMRVVAGPEQIVFIDDDARKLAFPVPEEAGQETGSSAADRLALSWDQASDVIRVRDQDTKAIYEFGPRPGAAARPLTAIADAHGNRIEVEYGDNGAPALLAHSGGYRVGIDTGQLPDSQLRVGGLRLLSQEDTALANILGYEYDRRGRMTGVTDSSGIPLQYEWDDHDRITAWTDRGGYRFAYYYDERGRVERAEGADGLLSGSFEYHDEERRTRYTDSLGQVTEHHYDEDGNIVKVVDPLGHAALTEYDARGQALATADKTGARTVFTFDERGNTVRIEHADGGTVSAEYDDADNLTRMTEPGGAAWLCEYDEAGRIVASTDPLGALTRYAYAETGALTRIADPLGGITHVTCDDAGLVLSVTDPSGAAWTVRRNVSGQVTTETDPLGAETRFAYDSEGRVVSRTAPDGTVESWDYDVNGNLVRHQDEAGAVTLFEAGPFQTVTAKVDADGARHTFAYDTELRLTQVEGPLGHRWTYAYDAAGNLAEETDFNGRRLAYAYDPAGRLTRQVNGTGQAVELVRDTLGRITGQRIDGAQPAEFAYDPAGNLASARTADSELSFTWDNAGNLLSEGIGHRQTVSAYDAIGRRVALTTPSGRMTRWAYDLAGNLTALSAPERSISFGHDRAGRETYRWLSPGLALDRQWDGNGRETGIRLLAVDGPPEARVGRSIQERSYRYRADGILSRSTDSVLGAREYSLDTLGRVTGVTGRDWNEQYAYDRAGNLLQATDSRTPQSSGSGDRELSGTLLRRAGRTRYEHDGQGRVIRAVRRTLSGQSRTWTYAYDAYDRLTTASAPDGSVWSYRYDALGRRTEKLRRSPGGDDSPAEITRFAWDGAALVEEEHVNVGAGQVTVTAWDYQPGTWTPLAQSSCVSLADAPQEVIDQRFHAIVTDPVGTPTELVDPDSGAVAWRPHADLWGQQVAVDRDGADCPLRHPGQYHDRETGLYYNCRRYYDPATGRYTSPDPLGLAPAPNHHAYVPNPLRWTDPLGLASEWNPTFANRKLAFNAARDLAGVPRSAAPIRQWTVGGDPKSVARANYLYRPYDPKAPAKFDPRAGWGRYYQYDTPQGQRVIVEHVADPRQGPHFHAGKPQDGAPRDIDMRAKTYKKLPPDHHLYYEDGCGG